MEAIQRIIISRTDSIGDVVLTLPMAKAIKQLHPHCKVIFLGRTYTENIVLCNPHVDKFVAWDKINVLTPQQQLEYIKQLNADCMIHVFPNKQIAKLAKQCNIPLRIGTRNRIFHWTTCNKLVSLSRKNSPYHESQLNLKLLIPLGAQSLYSLHEVTVLQEFNPPKLSSQVPPKLSINRFNLVIHPKSKGSAREWGIHNYSALIETLPAEHVAIFITGTQQEGDMIRDVLVNPFKTKVMDLTGQQNLSELITFLSQADAILAASTGPLHIGASLGIWAMGLFPPMRPIHPGRWAPIGRHTKVFVATKECNACRNTTECACMQAISPEQVLEFILEKANEKLLRNQEKTT